MSLPPPTALCTSLLFFSSSFPLHGRRSMPHGNGALFGVIDEFASVHATMVQHDADCKLDIGSSSSALQTSAISLAGKFPRKSLSHLIPNR